MKATFSPLMSGLPSANPVHTLTLADDLLGHVILLAPLVLLILSVYLFVRFMRRDRFFTRACSCLADCWPCPAASFWPRGSRWSIQTLMGLRSRRQLSAPLPSNSSPAFWNGSVSDFWP